MKLKVDISLLTCGAAAVAVCIAAVLSCGKKHDTTERSPLQTERLHLLNDSLNIGSQEYVSACDSLMRLTTDSTDYYEIYLAKGMQLLLCTQLDSVMKYAGRTLAFTEKMDESPRKNTMTALATSLTASAYHVKRSNTEESIRLYRKAYDLLMQSDHIEKAPDAAANLADAYTFASDMPTAAKWYRRALVLVDSLGLPESNSTSLYMGMGRIYTSMQDYTTANKYYKRAMEKFDQMELNMQYYLLNDYGNMYYYSKQYDKAIGLFRRLKQSLEKHGNGDSFDFHLCLINMSDVFLNLNQLDSAETYVAKAEEFFTQNGVIPAIYYANTIKIGIATKKKDYGEVERIVAGENLDGDIEQNMVNIRNGYMQKYLVAKGDYEKAFENLCKIISEEDSLEYDKMNMRTAEIMQQLTEDTLKLHHQLELKAKDETVIRTQMTLLAFVSITLILLTVIAYISMYIRKKKLQNHVDIIMLRLEKARQRISPHFVFNLLNSQIGKDSKEADNLVKLSKLIRKNIEMTGRMYVTISEEIDFVKRYVELQRTLIGDSLVMSIEKAREENVGETLIPPMFVQILVENAIKHGLKSIGGEKRLNIQITSNEDFVMIDVTDNGPGFDIRRQGGSESTKTGLNIIRQTIALINAENKSANKMRFTISNIEDENGKTIGCKSTIIIPKNIKLI